MDLKKILVAIDSSPYSMKAAEKGFQLAHQLKASLALVFVIDKTKEPLNADLGISPEQSAVLLLKQAGETIEQLIKLYDGITEVYRFMPEGYPKKEIINTAKQWGADVIVMGTHGHTGLVHLLVGSVAEYVIRHAPVPVLVVPDHDN
jgi:nucleotide-binding universal stress UspA family protein